jgi:WD40 repeat protein
MSRLGGWMFPVGVLAFLSAWPGLAETPRPVDSQGDPLPRGARARLGTTRFRHGGPVYLLRCLSDGKTLVSYGADSMLRFWDAGTGKELRFTRLTLDLNQGRFPQLFGLNAVNVPVGALNADDGRASHCLSADGRLLIIPQGNSVLKVRDLTTGKTQREIKTEPGVVRFVTLSPDDRLVAAAVIEQDPTTNVQTGRIRMWELATGKELPALVGPAPKENQQRFLPHHFQFAPDGKSVAAVGQEFNNRQGIVRIWHLGKDREPIRLLEHGGAVGPVVFSPDGKFLAEISANPVTGNGPNLRIWDAATGKEVQVLGEQRNNQGTLVFTPDGKRLIDFDLGSQTLRVWDLAGAKEIVTLANLGGTLGGILSPDGQTLALAGNDQTIRLVETATGKALHELKGFQNGFGFQNQIGGQGLGAPLAFGPDGKTLFAAAGNVIRRWNVNTGEEMPITSGPEYSLQGLAFSRDGTTLVTIGEGGFRFWDPTTGKHRKLDVPMPAEDEAGGNALSLAFSPDGKILALGWGDGHISLHDAVSGKELHQLIEGHDIGVLSLVFTGDSKSLLSACGNGRVQWWSVSTGKPIRQLAGPPRMEEPNPLASQAVEAAGPLTLALTPDGSTVAGAGMDNGLFKVRFWELTTGKLRRQLVVDNLAGDLADRARLELGDDSAQATAGNFTPALAIAPDGKHLAIGAGPNIELRELRHGREVRQYAIYGTLQCLVFSPNGKYLAGSSDDGSIRIWEAATGSLLTELRGHRGSAAGLAFSPDGATLASAGNDTTVLFWDLRRCIDMDAPITALQDAAVAQMWKDLAVDDAEAAFKAMQQLAERPEQAMPLLREQLKPVVPIDAEYMAKLVADLESARFDQRKRAAAELEKLAELAEPALKARLADDPPLDLKQRLEKLLEQSAGPATVPELVRAMRGIETLERIGTPEARQLVETMAQGASESRVTQAAKKSLERLTRKE